MVWEAALHNYSGDSSSTLVVLEGPDVRKVGYSSSWHSEVPALGASGNCDVQGLWRRGTVASGGPPAPHYALRECLLPRAADGTVARAVDGVIVRLREQSTG